MGRRPEPGETVVIPRDSGRRWKLLLAHLRVDANQPSWADRWGLTPHTEDEQVQGSAEIRWFWRDAPPPGLEDWFLDAGVHGCPASGEEARTDVYLRDPGQTELGLKRRGGKAGVEVKALVAVTRDGVAAAPFAGPAETWTKVSTGALEFPSSITTHKLRRTRTFDTRDARPVEVPPGRALPPAGCNVELTRVSVDGQVWWTFGLEAFGTRGALEAGLRATAVLLAERRPPALGNALCASYPAWLGRLDL